MAEQIPDPRSRRYRAGAAVRDWTSASVYTVRDRFSTLQPPSVASASTLERHLAAGAAVDQALTAAAIDHFASSDSETRVRFGVRHRDRAAALRALQLWAQQSDELLVVGVPTPARVRGAVPAGETPAHLLASPSVVASLPVTDPGGHLVLGLDEGVRIDWWDVTGDGALVSGSSNRWAQRLPVDVQVPMPLRFHDLALPSLGILTDRHVDDITMPVDAVITWVDAADPAWRQRYLEACGHDLADEQHASRYRSVDELRYTLRSLATYTSWLRHVYLVTDGQRPPWLREDARLTVVDHHDLWPDQQALPVFNSHAIEARLHHIPGLAEQWVYVNDDVLVGRDLGPGRFFTPSGDARFFPTDLHVGFGAPGPGDGTPSLAGRTTRAVLAEATGRVQTHKLAHTPHPQLRAVAAELEQRFPAQYERTWRARVRSADDLAPITLQSWYGYATGRFVPGDLEQRYYDLRTQALAAKLRYLTRHRHLDTFCLNMGEETGSGLAANQAVVASFLPAFLPFRSPWEDPS